MWGKKEQSTDLVTRTWRISLLNLVESGEVCSDIVCVPIEIEGESLECSLCLNEPEFQVMLLMEKRLGRGRLSPVKRIALSLACCSGCVTNLTRSSYKGK